MIDLDSQNKASQLLVQGPVRGDHDLKDALRIALRAGTSEALDELHQIIGKTGAGLAALHHCGARHGETINWEDEFAELRGELEKLSAVLPWLADAAMPLLIRLKALAGETAAEPALPSHRSFRPQQVLIHQGNIGFIDFDGFCLAEPALDIALFRATIKEMASTHRHPIGRKISSTLAMQRAWLAWSNSIRSARFSLRSTSASRRCRGSASRSGSRSTS